MIEIENENDNEVLEELSNQADISVELNNSSEQLLNLGVTDFSEEHLTAQKITQYENEMNSEQKFIYNEIIEQINHQEQHRLGFCKCGNRPDGIRRFISGVAG